MQLSKKQYALFVQKRAESSSTVVNTIKAYVCGGLICVLGQVMKTAYLSYGLSDTQASTATSVTIIAIAAILTAAHIFDSLATFAGAGTLVPITGFANSVVAAAIEYKAEGFITGLSQKMFIIAGPVIVYGTAAAFFTGLVYYIFVL